ncbi:MULTISPECIES: hypothetical protein [Enterococcus]|uniref:hypothetical protein n=1 Tax=Enterococcus TaxID=1350 RepID=UPI000A36DE6B|nr:hypothetical protein [Enterococcus sp. 4E1_DIV0656]OTO09324.1 hypothetical protein A5882_003657 [Enterococcus sp. 4E1_DIV0656]
MNLLYGNFNGCYLVSAFETERTDYHLVGSFQTIKEKLELIEYHEAMFLDELYWTDYNPEESDLIYDE